MASTTVSSILRARQAYCIQICEKQTLEHGIAYYCDRFAPSPEANQFREVITEDPDHFEAAFDEAESWYSQHNLTCLRWAPAAGQPTDLVAGFLEGKGFKARSMTAMALSEWVDLAPDPSVRILPARAMRPALRATFQSGDPDVSDAELAADELNERLDDPHLDVSVAMVASAPAGRGGLHEVGDIGRILVPSVPPAFRDSQVARSLLAHSLALAKRLTMRTICACVDTDDSEGRTLLEEAGFAADGTIVEFERITHGQP